MIKEVEEKVLMALDEIRPFLEKKGGQWSIMISLIIILIAMAIYFISK